MENQLNTARAGLLKLRSDDQFADDDSATLTGDTISDGDRNEMVVRTCQSRSARQLSLNLSSLLTPHARVAHTVTRERLFLLHKVQG